MKQLLFVAAIAALLTGSTAGSVGTGESAEGKIVWSTLFEGWSVSMIDAQGRGFRTIAPAIYRGPDVISSFNPALSPDGRMVAFSRRFSENQGSTKLCTRSVLPPFPKSVCRTRFGSDALQPVWSPNGREIAFVRARGLRVAVAVLDVPRRRIRELTRLRGVFRGELAEGTLALEAWAPDGRRLVFASEGDLFTIRSDGSRLRRLTRSPGVADAFAGWSPDASKIAWLRSGNVHVMSPDGREQTRVTSTPLTPKGPPAWSPDRSSPTLAFRIGGGLYVTRNCYHRPERLPGLVDVQDVAWSPDGSALVAIGRGSARARTRDLWVTTVDGSTRRRILRANFRDERVSLQWRP